MYNDPAIWRIATCLYEEWAQEAQSKWPFFRRADANGAYWIYWQYSAPWAKRHWYEMAHIKLRGTLP